MIHVGDNTWNLRIFITDLQVEKTLRVRSDLHIGGVMLKLVDPGTYGWLRVDSRWILRKFFRVLRTSRSSVNVCVFTFYSVLAHYQHLLVINGINCSRFTIVTIISKFIWSTCESAGISTKTLKMIPRTDEWWRKNEIIIFRDDHCLCMGVCVAVEQMFGEITVQCFLMIRKSDDPIYCIVLSLECRANGK